MTMVMSGAALVVRKALCVPDRFGLSMRKSGQLPFHQIFEFNNFDDINYFLGLELDDEVQVIQPKFADTILYRFGMKNARPAATPMEKRYRDPLGALLYLSALTRPDISTSVRHQAQKTERPTAALKDATEHVFCYLGSTKEHGLVIRDDAEHDGLVVYCDASFAVERERESSTVFFFFSDVMLWNGVEKNRQICRDVHQIAGVYWDHTGIEEPISKIVVMDDHQGAQHLAESKGVTQRSLHIEKKYH
ncbi:hypothetical protein PsorP6_001146 [Peronosclerospora sorghi]|uniref:Uncharacterized protein n=1 Tax=Peronosclerospora sorghi TaxID=230839 RepID=A0ACC0WR58_9STRA|nr:hypothetical protein PsorP6_001146 [Peronosclerospora sorghi]